MGVIVKCAQCGERWELAFTELYQCGCDRSNHKTENRPLRPLQGRDSRDPGTLELWQEDRKVKARQLDLL